MSSSVSIFDTLRESILNNDTKNFLSILKILNNKLSLNPNFDDIWNKIAGIIFNTYYSSSNRNDFFIEYLIRNHYCITDNKNNSYEDENIGILSLLDNKYIVNEDKEYKTIIQKRNEEDIDFMTLIMTLDENSTNMEDENRLKGIIYKIYDILYEEVDKHTINALLEDCKIKAISETLIEIKNTLIINKKYCKDYELDKKCIQNINTDYLEKDLDDLMLELYKKINFDINTLSEDIKNQIRKNAIKTLSLKSLEYDVNLFRYYGPVNGLAFNHTKKCKKYGGCRMLSCKCYEFENEFGEFDEEESWFKRQCQVCSLYIRNKSNSLRVPLSDGGWMGCFCSTKCIDKYLELNENENTEKVKGLLYGYDVESNINIHQIAPEIMIKNDDIVKIGFYKKLNVIGLQKR